jgi:hypothetical protein
MAHGGRPELENFEKLSDTVPHNASSIEQE